MIGSRTADVIGFVGSGVVLAAYAWQTLRDAALAPGIVRLQGATA